MPPAAGRGRSSAVINRLRRPPDLPAARSRRLGVRRWPWVP